MRKIAPLIVAHRGASHDAPENTLAAFRLAWKQGADAIEGDFRRTRDGRLVCIHDADTSRVAGRNLIVADSDFASLRALDAGSANGPQFAGEKIPSIEDVLATVPAKGRIFLEIKDGPESIGLLKEAIIDSGLFKDQCFVIAFNPETVAESKRQIPEVKTLWITALDDHAEGLATAMDAAYGSLTEDEAREFARRKPDHATIFTGTLAPSPETILDTLARIAADGVNLGAHPRLDAEFVKPLLDAKKMCCVWTVDDPAEAARCAALGLAAVTTNRPGRLHEGLAGL